MAGVMSCSCGACKFLRRKCTEGCVFAPYFSYDQGAIHFAAVHKVFGASNVSKLLLHLPIHHRGEAAATVSFEAQARMRDPVYGCVAYIFALQQQVVRLQEEIESITTQLANLNTDQCMDQPSPHTMDTLFQSFHHCMHKEDYNNIYGSTNLHMRVSNVQDSFNNTNDEEVSQEMLHPVFREAINRLEHSLLSDLT